MRETSLAIQPHSERLQGNTHNICELYMNVRYFQTYYVHRLSASCMHNRYLPASLFSPLCTVYKRIVGGARGCMSRSRGEKGRILNSTERRVRLKEYLSLESASTVGVGEDSSNVREGQTKRVSLSNVSRRYALVLTGSCVLIKYGKCIFMIHEKC